MFLLQPTTLSKYTPAAHDQTVPQLQPRSTFCPTARLARTTRTSSPRDQMVPTRGLQLHARATSSNNRMARPPDCSHRQLLLACRSYRTTHRPPPGLQDLQHILLLPQAPGRAHRLEQPRYPSTHHALGSTHRYQHQHSHAHADRIPCSYRCRTARRYALRRITSPDDTRLLCALRLRRQDVCLLASAAGELGRQRTRAGVLVDRECDGGNFGKASGVAG